MLRAAMVRMRVVLLSRIWLVLQAVARMGVVLLSRIREGWALFCSQTGTPRVLDIVLGSWTVFDVEVEFLECLQ